MLFNFVAARIKNDKGMAAEIPAAIFVSLSFTHATAFTISSATLPAAPHIPVFPGARTYFSYSFPRPAG